MNKQLFKKWWFWGIVILIIGAINGARNIITQQPEEVSSNQIETVQAKNSVIVPEQPFSSDEPITGTLGISVDQFTQAFNSSAKEFQTGLKISKLSIIPDDVNDNFIYVLVDNLSLQGIVDKTTGNLRQVTVTSRGDGSADSGADILLSIGVLIMATNPTLNTEDRGAIIRDIGFTDENTDFSNLNRSTVRNGLQYQIESSDTTGIRFSISEAIE
ncbi:hypothetical protein J2T13_005324 [Paenibacillus sp. DS2015]|uniref:hypothetical protein n=1 Tax=Paenibacillus sp. DS2015 TaxID=3373917 RepID=UPI003D2111E2